MNAYSSEGASLRARVPPECPAAVMIMVSCHITHWNVKPGKAARVGQRNLRNEKVADVAELFLRSLCPLSCVPAQPSPRPRCRAGPRPEDRQHSPQPSEGQRRSLPRARACRGLRCLRVGGRRAVRRLYALTGLPSVRQADGSSRAPAGWPAAEYVRDDQGDEHRRKSGNTAEATTPANPALY